MGRWESTKKIRPFRGAYYFGEVRRDEKERLRQLEQANRRDAIKNNGVEATLAKKQNLYDDYGLPKTQAEVELQSTAEQLDNVQAEDVRLIDELRDREKLIAYLATEGYSTESEFERAVLINAENNISTLTMKQLTKLADKLGVHYEVNNDIVFADDYFQHAIAVAVGIIDQSGQYEPVSERRRLIADIYHNNLRDPTTINVYEDMKAMIVAHYNLDETRNANGTPIGNYGRYLHYYDAVYDEYRRMEIYPSFNQVIEGMDTMITIANLHKRMKARETRKRNQENKRALMRQWTRDGLNPSQMDSISFIEFHTPI